MRIDITDRVTYGIGETSREITDEGYLRVPGRVARTGIQEYLASELQLPGDPNRVVRVMRPPEEVFNANSMSTLDGADITVHHPPDGMVTSETFGDLSKGTVKGPGRPDGDHLIANLIIKDKDAIQSVNDGLSELSCGYAAEYDPVVPEGADYEFIQRGIAHNHVALVIKGRAGGMARLYDHELEKPMAITLDTGTEVIVEDKSAAALISNFIERQRNALVEMNDTNERNKATIDAKDGKIEELKKLTSDAAIKKRVKAVSNTIDSAKLLCGKSFVCDSMDIVEIEKKAMKSLKPKVGWEDKSDVYIQAAFDMAVLDKDEEEEEKEMSDEEMEEEKKKKKSEESYEKLSSDAATIGKIHTVGDISNAYVENSKNRWKREA